MRTNERAAAALGISVPGTKVYAFALSAGVAAVGGTLLAFRTDVIIYGNVFPNFNSILSVAYGFIGGIGYLFGPMNGSTARARVARREHLRLDLRRDRSSGCRSSVACC